MTPLQHIDPDCRGVVVLTYVGAPSSERTAYTHCTGCGAEHREPVDRRAPVVIEGEGCDR